MREVKHGGKGRFRVRKFASWGKGARRRRARQVQAIDMGGLGQHHATPANPECRAVAPSEGLRLSTAANQRSVGTGKL